MPTTKRRESPQEQRSADLAALRFPHLLAARHTPRDRFKIRAHTELIGEQLAAALRRPGARVAIITPPQVGKTELANVWTPAWLLMRNPHTKIITTSYGQNLANRNGRRVRNLVRDIGGRYGVRLARDAKSVAEWSTSAGGGLKSSGIGGGITGYDADIVLVDDIWKNRAQAESPAEQQTAWDWLSSSMLTRLAPSSPVVMIGTLWTERDPVLRLIDREGRAEEGGKWSVIHLPALADLKLTGGTDPLGRRDGEPLTHPKIPDRDVVRLLQHWEDKRSGLPLALDWHALYQGDPHPREGALISWDKLQEATIPAARLPEASLVVVAVDPSGGGGDEVGIITGIQTHDERVIITADDSAVMPVTEWPERVCDIADRAQADRILLEVNFANRLVEQAIRTAWSRKPRSGLMPAIISVRALRGKVLRAEPVAQEVAMGRVLFVGGLTHLQRQWASYRAGSVDSPGALDASAYIAINLLRPAGTEHLVKETGPRRLDTVSGRAGRRLEGRTSPGGRRLPGR